MKHVNLCQTNNAKEKKEKKTRNCEVPFAMPLMCAQRRSHVERSQVGSRTVTSMLLSTALL